MRIIFMGTPEFSIPSLDILLKNKYEVVAVITATDKLGGRNKKQLIESDIKKYALEKGLTILQPRNLKSESFIEELRELNADLQIVVAFRMLPEVVWNMPRFGTFNLHASLLPKYRGAAPINWAIINGELESGVTSFKLKHEIDTGDIFLQKRIPILSDDTAGDLHDKMKEIAAQTVLKTVKAIRYGKIELQQQDPQLISKAPKIFREDCEINWNNTTKKIYDHIRGLSPYPTAWTQLNGETFKIYKSKKIIEKHNHKAGSIHSDNKSFLRYATEDGFIECYEIQLQGKRKMDIKTFLNGYQV